MKLKELSLQNRQMICILSPATKETYLFSGRKKKGAGFSVKSLSVGMKDCASPHHCAGLDEPPTFLITLRARLGALNELLAQFTQSSTVSKGQRWNLSVVYLALKPECCSYPQCYVCSMNDHAAVVIREPNTAQH